MKKPKSLLLAATAFFAFGTFVNAATTVDFTKLTLDNKTGIEKNQMAKCVPNVGASGDTCSNIDSAFEIKYLWTTKGLTKDKKYMIFDLADESDLKPIKYTCKGDDTDYTRQYVYVDSNGKIYSQCDIEETKNKDVKYSLVGGDCSSTDTNCTEISVQKAENSNVNSIGLLEQEGVKYSISNYSFDLLYSDEKVTLSTITASGTGGTAYFIVDAEQIYNNKDAYILKNEKQFPAPDDKGQGYALYDGSGKAKLVGANGVVETAENSFDNGSGSTKVDEIVAIYAASANKNYYQVKGNDNKCYYAEISNNKFVPLKTDAGKNPCQDLGYSFINDNGNIEFIDENGATYSLSGDALSEINEKSLILGGVTITYDASNISFKKNGELLKTISKNDVGLSNSKAGLDKVSKDKIGDDYFVYTISPKVASGTSYSNYEFQIFKMTVGSTSADTLVLDAAEKNIEVGKDFTLKATASSKNASITWKSSDESIAKVVDGKVTGVKAGSATITASWGKLTATCKVNVLTAEEMKKKEEEQKQQEEKKTDATTIELATTAKTLKVSETFTLDKTVKNANGTTTFTSSDPEVAKVDENGKITAVKVGTATITVENNGVKATCKITVTATGSDPVNDTPNGGNPHTGAAISIVSVLALGSAGVVINKKKGKNKFNRI